MSVKSRPQIPAKSPRGSFVFITALSTESVGASGDSNLGKLETMHKRNPRYTK